MNDLIPSKPTIDFLITADRAEAINGKLYLMGGAWDRLWVGDFTKPQSVSFAVGIVVPWNSTNEEHALTVRLVDQDEVEIANVRANFAVGASAQVRRSESQRATVAVQIQAQLKGPGTYKLIGMIDDDPENCHQSVFYASERSAPQAP
jgi:hypothetical protein